MFRYRSRRRRLIHVVLSPGAPLLLWALAWGAAPKLDESPAGDEDWGYRPAAGAAMEVNPPSFCWRPQQDVVSWELECARSEDSRRVEYRTAGVRMNVHCPPRVFPAGEYAWRYRGVDKEGSATNWSRRRRFTIPSSAAAMPMPPRDELLARIPTGHPRLFLRPEDLPRLRRLAQGPMRERYRQLAARCEELMADPPTTSEPRKYPADMERGSQEWKALWWGNRTYTIRASDGAVVETVRAGE